MTTRNNKNENPMMRLNRNGNPRRRRFPRMRMTSILTFMILWCNNNET
jgi:hypothetical protein